MRKKLNLLNEKIFRKLSKSEKPVEPNRPKRSYVFSESSQGKLPHCHDPQLPSHHNDVERC
jgi:hypothetical protein